MEHYVEIVNCLKSLTSLSSGCLFLYLIVYGGPTRVLAQPGYLCIAELQYMNVVNKEGNLHTAFWDPLKNHVWLKQKVKHLKFAM